MNPPKEALQPFTTAKSDHGARQQLRLAWLLFIRRAWATLFVEAKHPTHIIWSYLKL
jgi:hypothetical protein